MSICGGCHVVCLFCNLMEPPLGTKNHMLRSKYPMFLLQNWVLLTAICMYKSYPTHVWSTKHSTKHHEQLLKTHKGWGFSCLYQGSVGVARITAYVLRNTHTILKDLHAIIRLGPSFQFTSPLKTPIIRGWQSPHIPKPGYNSSWYWEDYIFLGPGCAKL